MKTPQTNTQEVLYTLIENGKVSIFDYPYLSGFRTRISELKNKYGLKIETKKMQNINRFGNNYTFSMHYLVDKQQAVSLYEQINSKQPTFPPVSAT